ncbi:TolC family protein [Clostridium sp. PL3]|uniref:TolC family protein n=1 Tax=Clostridium thailandense TaxID=2794346 RepID=A0A949WQE1_9CLOT|nr:TolC family protein [Clostridium thailandense]MBV7272646.1 TolC family protein [Clostridium thailandense]
MRKKLSLLVALAISLSISTTSLAAAASTTTSTGTSTSIQTDSATVSLTMGDAVNNIETSNTEIKLMNDKLVPLNKQYDLDHNVATSLKTDTPGLDNKLQVETQQTITPLKDEQNVKNQKYAIDVRLNNLKFDMQRQYLNVLTCRDQIDNINKTLVNIDEQIKKTQDQINVGQATADSLNSLNVQKSQLTTQIDSINSEIEESLLTIKQYLNIDLNKDLNLYPAQKQYIKFDDTNIADKINKAVENDYGVIEAKTSLDIVQRQKDLYVKYDNNSSGGVSSAESSLITAQGSVTSTYSNALANLWSKYYTLKSDENAVETELLTEKSVQDAYDKAKSNYDNGMIDKVTLDSAELALEKQKNLAQRATNEYMIIQEQFKYMLDGHASAQPSTQAIGISGVDY